ncbi:cytochrome P450 [Nocardia sp. NPDC004068]|uniref:cytochrome P450 n=1 Tax=Nocardia sp. NPDC004068 TaxID=3364303 RepID=UPI0036C1F35F
MSGLDHLPGPPGRPLLGSLIPYTRDRGAFVREALREHGDVCRVRLPVRDAVLIGHPEDAARYLNDTSGGFQKLGYRLPLRNLVGGVAFQEGERFRAKRSAMASMFAGASLAGAFGRAADTIEGRVDDEIAAARAADVVDLQRVVSRLVLAGLLAALFTEPLPAAQVRVVDQGLRLATAVFGFIRLTGGPPNLVRGPDRMPPHAVVRLYRTVAARVRGRRASAQPYDDLLAAMLELHARTGSPADDLGVTNELVLLLSASYEAMTSAVTHTFARVLADPAATARLRAECATLPPGAGIEAVRDLRWARACFEEALRLQGSAPLLRIAARPSTARGYRIPSGVPLVFPLAVIHRDPRWWPEPDRFAPERFLDTAPRERRAGPVYLPFGTGPHRCLAAQLAYGLVPFVLAAILRRYRPALPPDWTMVERPGLAPLLAGGLPVRLGDR